MVIDSERQPRPHSGGSGHSGRPFRVDHGKRKRFARGNVLHPRRRLVRLALRRGVRQSARVSILRAITRSERKGTRS